MPEAPIGELDAFGEQVDLLFDLIALAYRADLTRVASYIMVAEGTNRTYNHIGVSDSFHPVSHHANDLGRLEKLVKIQTWHMERFAAFVDKLAAVPDGDGTLLDHSMFLYGSNMSNSDRHNGHPLPTILVGGGNGTLRGSQHIELPQPTPLANLHLTILEKAGARAESRSATAPGLIAGVCSEGQRTAARLDGNHRAGPPLPPICRASAASARTTSRPRGRTRPPVRCRARVLRQAAR